jgi:hypothetical protein
VWVGKVPWRILYEIFIQGILKNNAWELQLDASALIDTTSALI